MSTSTLVDRAEQTTADLTEAARAHLAEAEQYAIRAAEAATIAAEHYGARAARSAQQAADTLRDDVESLLDDPETREVVVRTAAGVAVLGLAVWLWRRRKRKQRREEARYEATASDVAGWTDPKTGLTTASTAS